MAIDLLTRDDGPPLIVGDAADLADLAGFAVAPDGVALVLSRPEGLVRRPLAPASAERVRGAGVAIVVHMEGDAIVAAFRLALDGTEMREMETADLRALAASFEAGAFTAEPLDEGA